MRFPPKNWGMTEALPDSNGSHGRSSPPPRQYLTFVLAEEVFALEINRVREVLEVSAITRVPRTPDFMRGVINLRGSVVPIVDLKQKMGIGQTEMTVDTCIVIVEVAIEGQHRVIGALADSVKEVVDLSNEQIDPPPRMGARVDTAFLAGICRSEDRFIILLDIDAVFSEDELRRVKELDDREAAAVDASRGSLDAGSALTNA